MQRYVCRRLFHKLQHTEHSHRSILLLESLLSMQFGEAFHNSNRPPYSLSLDVLCRIAEPRQGHGLARLGGKGYDLMESSRPGASSYDRRMAVASVLSAAASAYCASYQDGLLERTLSSYRLGSK